MRPRILAYVIVALAGILSAVLGSLVYPPTAISTENSKIYFFFSDYCPHCQEVKPYVEEIAKKRSITFCNVESMGGECSRIAEQFGLKYVPTMIILNNETKIYVGSNEVMRAIEVLK
ncbi:MAG: thioredoxin family protein [Candidatus Methanoglobus sp.]